MTDAPLASRLAPCGPVVDKALERRTFEVLTAAAADGWADTLALAWPALAPVFGASPYLGGLARRHPERLRVILTSDPDERLAALLADAEVAATLSLDDARPALRRLKAELHLLTALCDLGGVWSLDQATGALSRFADASLHAALAVAAQAQVARGRLTPSDGPAGPAPGLFCLALGKHGAFELNYSSDIDVSFFYEPDALPVIGVEPHVVALAITQMTAALLHERTADGYVFRVDLRLRPDPSSTPAAVPVEAALDYYESVGQNWERAAMIKARSAAGDIARGEAFVREMQPFIWRRTLDFAAIADIHSIKRQIHAHKVDERLTPAGANLKLGRGGIREIEFYVQTQQLILGGRDTSLRSMRTLDALAALAAAGHVSQKACEELTAAYHTLRDLEHRVQMLADEQTHVLPENDAQRKCVAALAGFANLRQFDAAAARTLRTVNARYGELFAEDEALSSRFGSLVFTGVEDDPETLATLKRMGFSNPPQVAATIRSWHHGRIAATRTERGRELFTRLAPRLLEAAHATGSPNDAFNRFGAFFAALSSGVQIQSLFLAQPKLFELVVEMMAFAPQLAATLARQPGALDALLDTRFFTQLTPAEAAEAMAVSVAGAEGFEPAMDAARRAHREQAFRIGVQVMSGQIGAAEAGRAFAALADACIQALAPVALAETARWGGDFPGEAVVVALGKAGGQEMSAGSDLDLMTVHAPGAPEMVSAKRGWSAETFFARFTQKLITALSSPTPAGTLYEVDMRLRPSGAAGPVAVSLPRFEHYYQGEAETWEFLALTRARVVWATSPAFAAEVTAAIQTALRRPRNLAKTLKEVREMRSLMARERPPSGPWDLKLGPGGLVDVEFAAQALQLRNAQSGGPLSANTAEALDALHRAGLLDGTAYDALHAAWNLQQSLTQVMKLALPDNADPAKEPPKFRALLARAGGTRDFSSLAGELKRVQTAAHAAFKAAIAS